MQAEYDSYDQLARKGLGLNAKALPEALVGKWPDTAAASTIQRHLRKAFYAGSASKGQYYVRKYRREAAIVATAFPEIRKALSSLGVDEVRTTRFFGYFNGDLQLQEGDLVIIEGVVTLATKKAVGRFAELLQDPEVADCVRKLLAKDEIPSAEAIAEEVVKVLSAKKS